MYHKYMKKLLVIICLLITLILLGVLTANKFITKSVKDYSNYQNEVANANLLKISTDKFEFSLPEYFKENKQKETGELIGVYESTLTQKDVLDMLVISVYPDARKSYTSIECERLASNQAKSLSTKLEFTVQNADLRKDGQACYYKLIGKLYENQNEGLAFRQESYAVLNPGEDNVLVLSISYGPVDADVMAKDFETVMSSLVLK